MVLLISQGLPFAPLAMATPSTPVSSIILFASSGVNISPLPNTGMLTASLTALIISQSAFPAYICDLVRPCMVMALTPACSAIFANSTAFTCLSSKPFLNLTVTGLLKTLTMVLNILPASSGVFIRAEPSPLFTIFGTGQPILTSMISKSSAILSAMLAIITGSEPNSCTATGCSSGAV